MAMNTDEVKEAGARTLIRFRISRGPLVWLALLLAVSYIALAVWGWGWPQWRGFFADPSRLVVCAALLALAGLTPLCGCNTSTGRRDDPSNNWIFPPLLLAGLLMGIVSGYCDRRNVWTFGGQGVRYAGLGLFMAGAALRIGSMRTLGPRFTVWVAIQEGHLLVTDGLYRFVRHPSYTGALLTVFGWALVFRSDIGLMLAGIMIPLLISRIHAEERLLTREFGAEYANYRARTWRLLPLVC